MKKRLFVYVALFTVVACLLFVAYNPNIAAEGTDEFSDGEVFLPHDDNFDFRVFTLNSSGTRNFTTWTIINGHTQFVDDTGNITVNLLELDDMFPTKRDRVTMFLNGELEKPSWTVDGVSVHEITFPSHDSLYSAYFKNSTENTIIYLSTPNEQQTADLMNSLEFKQD